MKRSLTVILLTLSTVMDCHAQELWAATVEDGLRMKVKQFESFLKRFNFTEGPMGEAVSDTAHVYLRRGGGASDLKVNRKMLLSTLLHDGLIMTKEQLCREFIEDVMGSDLLLSFYDRNWYASLPATMIFRGEEHKAQFTMKAETYGNNGSKWVICGLDAPFLLPKAEQDTHRHLPPNSHETRFLSLNAALEDGAHFAEYLPEGFEADLLTLLLSEVKAGKLKYGSGTEEPTFHFLQIPGWAVVVRFIIREERNHGWLITDLHKLNDSEKRLYRQELLHIRSGAE